MAETPWPDVPAAVAELVYSDDAVRLYHGDAFAVGAALPPGVVDAVITDPPYSERTHTGHDDGTASANRVSDWARREAAKGVTVQAGGGKIESLLNGASLTASLRRSLSYAAWDSVDVSAFARLWGPRARGWFLALTDHVLVPAWEASLPPRYVFAPLACVEPGRGVRMTGDGPASWTSWLVVARPRSRDFASWGALPGAYVVPPGSNDARALRDLTVPGGKPLWLMRALVRDYTREGDLIADPCAGAGTTGLAARLEGRRCLLVERDRETCELAADRLARFPAERAGQCALFAEKL